MRTHSQKQEISTLHYCGIYDKRQTCCPLLSQFPSLRYPFYYHHKTTVHLLFSMIVLVVMRLLSKCWTETDVNLIPSQNGYSRIGCSSCGGKYYQCHFYPKLIINSHRSRITEHIKKDHPISARTPHVTAEAISEENEPVDYS